MQKQTIEQTVEASLTYEHLEAWLGSRMRESKRRVRSPRSTVRGLRYRSRFEVHSSRSRESVHEGVGEMT